MKLAAELREEILNDASRIYPGGKNLLELSGGAHGFSHGEQRIVDARGGPDFGEPEEFLRAIAGEFIQRFLHRLPAQEGGFEVVEKLEAGIETGGEGVFAQNGVAEAVDGGDLGALDFAALFRLGLEAGGEALFQFGGRLFRKGDGEDFFRVDAFLDEPCETLDENAGFAGPRAGNDTDILVFAFDGGFLRAVQSRDGRLWDRHHCPYYRRAGIRKNGPRRSCQA